MRARPGFFFALSLMTVLGIGGASACVGDDPTAAKSDASPTPSATTSATTPGLDATTPPPDGALPPVDGAVPSDATADATTPVDASVDASVDDASVDAPSDAAPSDAAPSLSCATATFAASAFNARCSAADLSVAPGGAIVAGTYNMTRGHAGLMCDLSYFIGTAEVFTLGTGELVMRYIVLKRAAIADPGVRVTGTGWLQGTGANFSRTELCDPARLGQTQKGSLTSTSASGTPVFTLTFPDGQEQWTKI